MHGKIILYRNRGVIAALIRWQTRSVYSHAALLCADGVTVIEAREFVGVQARRLTVSDYKHGDFFDVAGMTDQEWLMAEDFMRRQIGLKYDYRSIARFLTREKAGERKRWFCSELVFAALRWARHAPLARTKDWAVAPGHLGWSPLLIGPMSVGARTA